MTLQNLSKILDKYEEQLGYNNIQQFEVLKDLPFYWSINGNVDKVNHVQNGSTLSFNHAIGLPQKNGQPMPLFDYEKMLFDTLQSNKHVWIKKATGLGVTEFMLRYMAWLCFNSTIVANSQMCIVTGPRIELAITLIDRMKGLFREAAFLQNERKISSFDTKEAVIELNGIHIEAYPSHHLDAMRGLKDLSFIYLDEADFFPPSQQQDARDVSERYIAKSNPYIVMVSTPNAPDGLFERIEKEPESTCLYKRLFLDYTYGLNKIYTQDEINAARASPSFEREYNLKYLGLIGNVFHTKDIESAINKGIKQGTDFNSYSMKSVGVDPSPGSAAMGICVTENVNGLVNVIHSEEIPRPDFGEMIDKTVEVVLKYNIRFDNNCRIFVDGANPSFIRTLKQRLREDPEYDRQINIWKSDNGANIVTLKWLMDNMFVLPVQFAKYHKQMLAHTKEVLEYHEGMIAINPVHNKLLTALRTAVEKGEGSLDKEATSHSDLFDAFRLSLLFWSHT